MYLKLKKKFELKLTVFEQVMKLPHLDTEMKIAELS